MVTFGKIDSSFIKNLKRILKFTQFGAKTSFECAPFGVDANPIKGMTAIHSTTSNNSEDVIIGYLNVGQLAEPGEVRLFSVDESGQLKSFIWLKNDGKIQLNGDAFSSVRFENLQTALNTYATAVNAETAKIQTAITALGGTYARTEVSIDISNSQSQDVLLK